MNFLGTFHQRAQVDCSSCKYAAALVPTNSRALFFHDIYVRKIIILQTDYPAGCKTKSPTSLRIPRSTLCLILVFVGINSNSVLQQ